MAKRSSAVIVANWLAFLSLFSAFLMLMLHGIKYKGPGRKHKYFHGFREQNMLGMFINLFCALSYFAKILESMTDKGAGFAPFTTIQYLDYCFTCPLIVLDLLWNVDAPFKATMTVLVFTCLVIAVASAAAPPPASYAWFTMGMFVFAGTYYGIVMLIQERLAFYVEVARDGNAKQSIKFLKTGCYIFFAIWILYPIFWVLSDKATGLVSKDLDHVITAVLDVFAKSAYGFALLYFRIYFDKKLEQSGVDVEDFKKFSEQSIYTPRKKSSSDQDNFDRSRINEYRDRRDRDYDYQDRRDRDYDYQERRDRDYDYQDRERRGHGPGGYDRGVPASDYGDARNNYHDEESGFRGERAGDHGDLATKIRKSLDRRGGRENGMGDSFRRDPASPSRLSMKLSTAGDTRDHLRSGGPTPPRLEMGALGTLFSSRPNSRTGSLRNIHDGLPQRNSSTRSSRESTPDVNKV